METNKSNTYPNKLINVIEDNVSLSNNLVRFLNLNDDVNVGIVAESAELYFSKRKEFPNHKPDVMLLDIGLPGMSGLDAIPKILEISPDIDIIMLTTFEEESKILKAMCQGAVAYLSKRTSLSEIINVIRIVNQGGSYMSPMIARDIFNYMVRSTQNPIDDILTSRQKEVINGLVEGKSHISIGKELFISPQTVRSHVKNIYKTLHVKNKAEAISKYLKKNL